MSDINREDLHIISRHSNLTESSARKMLQEKVYHNADAWKKFFQLFFLSLGVGFTTAGIIFFFAYNWADLNKFVKIGLIEGLIAALTCVIVFAKFNGLVKNIILTGVCVLAGALFAVFGQVYQTGANAYDFFLGWTVFITLWVIVADFAPLWLIYIVLLNTTLCLYSEQVASDWSDIAVFALLFALNACFWALFTLRAKTSVWFVNCLALMAAFAATVAVIIGLFDAYTIASAVVMAAIAAMYAIGIGYGFKKRKGFILAVIPFSVITIISAFFIKQSAEAAMFLFVSFFIIGSVTLLIKQLISIHKKWANG